MVRTCQGVEMRDLGSILWNLISDKKFSDKIFTLEFHINFHPEKQTNAYLIVFV
jgi:hypothetical protein